MITYVVFLRGINVGGHKKFPKANQVELLSDLNLQNHQVYLHTGNWVFSSSENKEILEKKLVEAIQEKQGLKVPILLKTASEIEKIMTACPFSETEKIKSYFILPFTKPSEEKTKEVAKNSFPNEEFIITSNCIYLYSGIGYGKSKLSNNFFENKLKLTATARNYNTMMKLIELSN